MRNENMTSELLRCYITSKPCAMPERNYAGQPMVPQMAFRPLVLVSELSNQADKFAEQYVTEA